MSIRMECYGLTDSGQQRESNQDQFLIGDLRKSLEVAQTSLNVEDHERFFGGSQGKLLIVADGMGAAGKRASALALDTLSTYALNSMHWFFRLESDSDEEFVADLRRAMQCCENQIRSDNASNPDADKVGTTLTIGYIIWPRAYIIHAGDSRCYLFRNKKLWQITRDHTLDQERLDEGIRPTPNEGERVKHVLWNCLGTREDVQPCAHRADLVPGDALLLCTDGLTSQVDDCQIEQLMARTSSAEDACHSLVDAANSAGGSDNVTVVVARFIDSDPQPQLVQEAAATTEGPSSKADVETPLKTSRSEFLPLTQELEVTR